MSQGEGASTSDNPTVQQTLSAEETAKIYAELPSLQDYWKTYASWLACWPTVAEARNNIAVFTKELEAIERPSEVSAYVVLGHHPIKVRSIPSISEDDATAQVVSPGQCVVTDKLEPKGGQNFLRLADGSGWLFDKLDGCPVLTKLSDVECGKWWYSVVCDEFVEVRSVPGYGDDHRNGWIMCPKELIQVSVRCNIRGRRHCQLADGRGWIFEAKPSRDSATRSSMDRGSQLDNNGLETVIIAELDMSAVDKISSHERVTVRQEGSFSPDLLFTQKTLSARKRAKKQSKANGMACFGLCGKREPSR